LKNFLITLFKNEGKKVDRVDIIFCKDKYVFSLNKSFLHHAYNTDTLTFLLSNAKLPIIGEVYISIERIRANAKDLSIPYKNELLRVIIHSCLHLCGYEDTPNCSAIKMKAKQEHYLFQWIVSRET
jgi:rRNA maturation RNase YbeY